MKKQVQVDVWVAFFITITLWASAFVGIRAALAYFSPLHLAFLRMLIGSVGLGIVAVIRKTRLPDLKDIPIFLLCGFFGFAVYHVGINVGEQTVSAGLSSLIVTLAPVFTAIWSVLFLKERLTITGIIGTVISFTGVALISISIDGSFRFTVQTLYILLAAFSESIYFVVQTPYLKKYDSIAFTTYTIWAAALFMVFTSRGVVQEIAAAPISASLIVLYLGIFPTIIAYSAMAYAISRIGSSRGTSSIYLTPVLTFFIAWILLREIPTWFSLLGGAVTIAGVLLVNRVTAKKTQNQKNVEAAPLPD